jgi:hypothetical protein
MQILRALTSEAPIEYGWPWLAQIDRAAHEFGLPRFAPSARCG